MSLESWGWFVTLVEKGSFTKAATSLQTSQQTLSARLAVLEKDLNAKLVERGTPLTLTPSGMAFLLYAREQQQAQVDLLRQIGDATGSGAGVLKVGVSHLRGRILMPQVIREVTQRLPDIKITLVEGTNRELERMAEHGEVDAAIARFGNVHPGVNVVPLFEEEVVLVVRADVLTRVTGLAADEAVARIAAEGLEALRSCPFVLGMVDDISGRVAYSELRNAGIKPRVVATSESATTLLTMAVEGLGATFTPSNALDMPGFANMLVRIPLSHQAKYTISLGAPTFAEPWHAMDIFTAALVEAAKA